ncbi:hypothetical protein ScPMuIL_005291 [Solemya velum]
MSEAFATPSYATDEDTKAGFLRVIVALKGLKTSTCLKRSGFLPSFEKKVKNATVEATFDVLSLCLTVQGQKGGMDNKKYQLKIRQLVHEIDDGKSYYEAEDDRILLFLCKKEDVSWYPELHAGLETAPDPPDETPDEEKQEQ